MDRTEKNKKKRKELEGKLSLAAKLSGNWPKDHGNELARQRIQRAEAVQEKTARPETGARPKAGTLKFRPLAKEFITGGV